MPIPKLRQGSHFPSFLEPRRKAEQALVAVLQEAYVLGVSTRKVDELVKSLGIAGISKSEVSRVCADLGQVVATGVRQTGKREILGHDLGPAEDGTFWLTFLRSLVARGLREVQLVVSDAHEGLRKALDRQVDQCILDQLPGARHAQILTGMPVTRHFGLPCRVCGTADQLAEPASILKALALRIWPSSGTPRTTGLTVHRSSSASS